MTRNGRPPSMVDVAELVGVSHQTVSRVVNGKGCVSPRTRERVQGAIGTSLASVWRCFGGVCAPCVERGELSARVPCQRVLVTKNAPMAAHLRASELQPVGKFE
ncbi:LacI family DNA-binding transcriptional regulator [Schaalia odontolytica]|uniref:LacI family DNA-binding transcriptional regulator n=2 Tax=Schaalia odontolytica TaxID=1660 RepID=UPI003C7483A7